MAEDRIGESRLRFLNDVDIVSRMLHPDPGKRLIVTPLISLAKQLGANSLDLRLGPEYALAERAEYTSIDPVTLVGSSIDDAERMYRRVVRVWPTRPFILHPGEQILGSTLECVRLPKDVIGFLEGRSTWARQGLGVHSTAGFVHAGSTGVITFELRNNGPVPIKLYTGVRVAQLCFAVLGSEPAKYYDGGEAKYSGSVRTEVGRPWEDYEFRLIKQAMPNDQVGLRGSEESEA